MADDERWIRFQDRAETPADPSDEAVVSCPHCGEDCIVVMGQIAAGETMQQGCQVCCRDFEVHCAEDAQGQRTITVGMDR